MKEEGFLTPNSIIGGTSGGSLAAAIACTDISPEVALDYLIEMSQSKAFRNNLHDEIKTSLRKFLPENSLEKCNGRLHVCVTKLWPKPRREVTIINQFDSVDKLLDVIAASCFIPLYSAPRVYAKVDHELFVDGGVFAFIPPVGEVRVSPIPLPSFIRSRRSHVHIISRKFSLPQLISHVLIPAPPETLRELFHEGQRSADHWVRKEQTKRHLSLFVEEPLNQKIR